MTAFHLSYLSKGLISKYNHLVEVRGVGGVGGKVSAYEWRWTNSAQNKLLIEARLMTSCVTTENSPNLSEPCFLHHGPASIISRHSERI